ncbi:MAG TPA: ABC-type transport auxiliary lipoprotein family protein [Lysobacter sp.]|nr:ABC-type transport auxiliary lipoprotein family protein [Lysobacter sp.]
MSMQRTLVAMTLVFGLAGCSLIPEKEPLALYSPAAKVAPDPAWPSVQWQLQIPRPLAPELVDSPRIVVRPAPGELQVYKGAVWAEPAPDLVQDAVLHAFEDSGRIGGVARRGSGVAGDYELLLDLRRFDSDYAGGASPRAEVEITAKLVANRSNTVIANRTFRHSAQAGGSAVGSVAQAFDSALGAAVADIVGWTLVEGQRYDAANPRLR